MLLRVRKEKENEEVGIIRDRDTRRGVEKGGGGVPCEYGKRKGTEEGCGMRIDEVQRGVV